MNAFPRAMSLVFLLFLLAGLLPLAGGADALYAQDPFRSGGAASVGGPDSEPSRDDAGQIYSGRLPAWFLQWSRSLQRVIASYSNQIRSGDRPGAGLLSFLAAVLFGMLHVLGPGHGKLFTISYVSSRKARPAEGILLAAGINVVDSLSAAALVFGGYALLSISVGSIQGDISRIIQIISYSLIIVFSAGHLLGHAFHTHDHHRNHDHDDHAHQHAHHHHEGARRYRSPLLLALSIGIIPCPVSTVLLIFGLVNDLVLHSVVLVAGVSLGGFITMAVMTLLLIRGREMAMNRLSGPSGERLALVLEIAGMGMIIVVAGVLLVSRIAG
jgi:nickel/cobalt exporter